MEDITEQESAAFLEEVEDNTPVDEHPDDQSEDLDPLTHMIGTICERIEELTLLEMRANEDREMKC